ncbi:MAG TPA: serine hydrolase [Candidatus Saccharimonadales bacterium]|nr:serine hydrolase [Candidatus Saccharimonadales bacterium]
MKRKRSLTTPGNRTLLPAAALALLAAFPLHARDLKLDAATQAIEKRIGASGAEVSVAFRTLDGKSEWFFRADDSVHAASTMKVPVMIELFHQVHEGKVRLDQPIAIKNEFHSIVDGSVFSLKATDDSETELYQAAGQTRSLAQLCELMITVSSNFATDLVIETLGPANVETTVQALKAEGVKVLRGVEDQKAYDRGLNNTTTARGLLVLMDAIAQGQAVDPGAAKEMIAILERQKFNEGIPAGVPPETKVAHKTGELPKINHDAAIVFAPRPYVLVVLVRGMADFKQSSALIADISRALYQASQ